MRLGAADPGTSTGRGAFDAQGLVCAAAIVVLVLAAFLPVLGNGFVAYDDEAWIVSHPVVARGLSWDGLAWAARTLEQGNWMPLTRVSHLLDVSLFGMSPRGHHLVGLLLHAATAVLLWLFLERTTRSRRASLAVALLFAVHPLRVESVAWASERKDVLAGLFWMLSLLAWTAHLRRPSKLRYLGFAGLFALGLAAKPSVVTLPVVLLVLDFWPFGRLRGGGATPVAAGRSGVGGCPRGALGCLLEKVPFLALSAAAAAVAYVAQRAGGAVDVEGVATPAIRASVALTALWGYLGKSLWPGSLSILTMHTMGGEPLRRAVFGALAFAGVTLLAAAVWRRRPHVAAGWLWYPVVLLPMSGIIQVGVQGAADRYTYLPLIGPVLAVVWSLRAPAARRPLAALALFAALTLTLAAATWRQTLQWRDSATLFGHAVAVNPGNPLARANLGHALTRAGRLEEANRQYGRVLEVLPRYPGLRDRLADNALALGRPQEALHWLEEESRLDPDDPVPLERMALILATQGKAAEAEAALREQIRRFPGNAPPWSNLGVVLAGQGRAAEARAAFNEALRLDPHLQAARDGLRVLGRRIDRPAPR